MSLQTKTKMQWKQKDVLNFFVKLFLFLASLNFVTRYYYWVYIAFAIFLFTPGRKFRFNGSTLCLLILSISMVLFDAGGLLSITDILKPFVFPLANIMGLSICCGTHNQEERRKQISQMILLTASGLFLHYALNLLININALERNTIDIWTNSVLSASGQASLACVSVGVVVAVFFSKLSSKYKIAAAIVAVMIVIYNLILAGRTLLLMMAILFVFAFYHKRLHYGKSILKGTIIFILIAILIIFLYSNNFLNIKNFVEQSNFYSRFFGETEEDVTKDMRLTYKLEYLKIMCEFPYGGNHIREKIGNYAHDIYLDTYDQFSAFAFFSIIIYIIASIRRLFLVLQSRKIFPFWMQQLIFCVYLAMNILFLLEPVMQGMPWMLIVYCLIDGTVAGYLNSAYRRE